MSLLNELIAIHESFGNILTGNGKEVTNFSLPDEAQLDDVVTSRAYNSPENPIKSGSFTFEKTGISGQKFWKDEI